MTAFTGIPKQIEETMEKWNGKTTRRGFLKSSGLFAVSVAAMGNASLLSPVASAQTSGTAQAAGPYPDPDFLQLDSWIVIHQDNTATF